MGCKERSIVITLVLMVVAVLLFLLIKFKKEEGKVMSAMTVVVVSLIVKGRLKYHEIIPVLKPEVKQMLIDIGCEYLIDEVEEGK